MPPELQAFDHIHVYVTNRAKAEAWYAEVLGLHRSKELEFWAADGGPLTIQNLRQRPHRAVRASGTALSLRYRYSCRCDRIQSLEGSPRKAPTWQCHEQDHEASMSLYFRDVDGNPYELTTYEVSLLKDGTEGGANEGALGTDRKLPRASETPCRYCFPMELSKRILCRWPFSAVCSRGSEMHWLDLNARPLRSKTLNSWPQAASPGT